jgi:ribonuclease D
LTEASNPFPDAFLAAVSDQDHSVLPQPVQPVFVDSLSDQQHLNTKLGAARQLGIDTEFIRETTFHPILALVQVALPNDPQQYLIDVPTLDVPTASSQEEDSECLSQLKQCLLCPETQKVMHGCSEDIEIFMQFCGTVPQNIFDTQMAAALLGARVQTGYEGLVGCIFGGQIDKTVTRSDWLQRPLSAKQLFYAAADVTYLLPLQAVLENALRLKGRLAWLAQEYEQLSYSLMRPTLPELAYQRIGVHWRLRGRSLYVLQQLCIWREHQVRERNIPRSFLLSDAAVLALAKSYHLPPAQLRRLEDIKPIQWRRYGGEIVEALKAIVHNAPEHAGHDLPVILPRSKKYRQLVKQLKTLVANRAKALSLETNVLLGKRYLNQFLDLAQAQYQATQRIDLSQLSGPPWLSGWRQTEILSHLVGPLEAWLKAQET